MSEVCLSPHQRTLGLPVPSSHIFSCKVFPSTMKPPPDVFGSRHVLTFWLDWLPLEEPVASRGSYRSLSKDPLSWLSVRPSCLLGCLYMLSLCSRWLEESGSHAVLRRDIVVGLGNATVWFSPSGAGAHLQSIEAPVDIRTSHCCPSSQQFCESPLSPFYREDTATPHDLFAGFHSQYSAFDSLPHLCSTVCLALF